MRFKGFTLIELLIVIAIISILSVIGYAVIGNSQKATKDARRKADIESIVKAYEGKFDKEKFEYSSLTNEDFSSGTIPKSPTNYPYTGMLTNKSPYYKICASLEGNSSPDCYETSPTCYCKSSVQGIPPELASQSGAGTTGGSVVEVQYTYASQGWTTFGVSVHPSKTVGQLLIETQGACDQVYIMEAFNSNWRLLASGEGISGGRAYFLRCLNPNMVTITYSVKGPPVAEDTTLSVGSQSIALKKGYTTTAYDFLVAMSTKFNINCTTIYNWTGGSWSSFPKSFGPTSYNNFDMAESKAYYVRCI